MKAIKITVALVAVFITAPIWLFLLHTLLIAAHADRLCMFLFWVYLPFSILISCLSSIITSDK